MSAPQPIAVTGGTGGISANRAAIRHLASVFRDAGAGMDLDTVLLGGEQHALPADLFDVLAGPAGLDLLGLAAARELLSAATGDLQRAADDTRDLAAKLVNAADGYPWGTTVLDVALLDRLDGILATIGEKVPGFGPRTVAGHGSLDGGGDELVAGWDPRAVDLGVDLVGIPALAELARPDDDGLGVAIATGSRFATAPRSLPDLISNLGDVDRELVPGGIDVRMLQGPDGRRVIVDITGTRTFAGGGRHVADLTTNTLALHGHDTAYEQGVLAAMRAAGVRHDDHVMLVGHSQGGMIAVNTARDVHRTGEFTVTHVITAGSPIGLTVGRLPGSVRVLALENTRDVVPRVDGEPNPDRRNITTVLSPHGDGSVVGNHDIDESYLPLAGDAQAGDSRSVRDFLTSAGGYLRATHAVAHSFRIERR